MPPRSLGPNMDAMKSFKVSSRRVLAVLFSGTLPSLVAACVLAFTASVQAQTQGFASNEADAGGPIPNVDLSGQIMFQVLAAEVAAQRGQVGSAARTYLDLAKQLRDPRLAQRATELALAARSLDIANPAAQLWFDLAPKSVGASQTIEALWLSTGKLSDAEPLLVKRLAQARKDKKVAAAYQQLIRMLGGMTDKKAALAMLERISREDLNVADARLALAVAAQMAEQPEKAAAEARAAVRLSPNSEDIVVGAARILGGMPKTVDEAIEVLTALVKRQPKALEGYFALGRLQFQKGQNEQAQLTFEAALKQEPQSPTLILALAQIALQGKHPKLAQTYLLRYIDLPDSVVRDNNLAYSFLGQIAEDQKDFGVAKDWYAKVGPGEQYVTAVTRQALMMGRTGQIEQARVLLKSIPSTSNKDRITLVTGEAQMLREAKRYNDAFLVLDEAVAKTRSTPDFLYDHALAAEKIDKLDLMEESLRRLIELRPDAAHAYNALGYSFAERNLRLPEAKDLIKKALELRPDDPHILDSMGWVLYRQGELSSARDYLEQALKISQEVDILIHLGEVLWKQGNQGEALKNWKDALAREPENEALKETLARLNVKL